MLNTTVPAVSPIRYTRHILTLAEYESISLPANALSAAQATRIWRELSKQLTLEEPSTRNGQQWRMTAQGWVGFLPMTPTLGLALQPKVPLHNLFRMLEIGWQLPMLRWGATHFRVSTLAEFYERLALLLAHQVQDRLRRGLYQAYIPHSERLPYLRGRLDVAATLRQPWATSVPCSFSEQTADVAENQILAWTLRTILRSGLCGERSLPALRRANHGLQGFTTLRPCSAEDCRQRLYHRLNQDYQPMHALCAFFLDHSGPQHHLGEQAMIPFVVEMARLYELFVAEWLKQHLPPAYRLQAQERYVLGADHALAFAIDLVIYERVSGAVRWVLDTKYKRPVGGPASEDVAQIHTYAAAMSAVAKHAVAKSTESKGAPDAVLIYPVPLTRPLDHPLAGIRVRTLPFALDGDLDAAGAALLAALGV